MTDKKIKMIVVDDEPNARRLMPVIIDWASLGYEYAGEASNGNEALDLIEAVRPDVVFTDINMPYMDGLEVAGRIAERDPLMKIVILTAYPEFEYAKRSVQIGVSDFLLKPLNPAEVGKLAVKLREGIERETAHWNEYLDLKDQLRRSNEQLKEKFLNELLSGTTDPEQLGSRYAYFFAEPFGSYCSVAVLEGCKEASAGEEDRLLFGMACRRVLEAMLQNREEILVFQDNGGRIVLLNRDPSTDLAYVGEQGIRAIRDKLNRCANVGVGSECFELSLVKESYKEALEALRYGRLTGEGQVISFGEDLRLTDGLWNLEMSGLDEALFFIKAGLSDQAAQAVESKFQALSALRSARIEQAQALAIQFLSMLAYELSELGLVRFRPNRLDSGLYHRIFGAETLAEMNSLLSELVREAAEFVHNNRSGKKNRIIDEVKEYLAREIPNPELGLASASRHFNLNPSYLSRIFKQETGSTFTDYLLKIRMESAVKLLNETDWKAYQIAEKVGIKDPYYFSHCFKRVVGVTIQEYKKGMS